MRMHYSRPIGIPAVHDSLPLPSDLTASATSRALLHNPVSTGISLPYFAVITGSLDTYLITVTSELKRTPVLSFLMTPSIFCTL